MVALKNLTPPSQTPEFPSRCLTTVRMSLILLHKMTPFVTQKGLNRGERGQQALVIWCGGFTAQSAACCTETGKPVQLQKIKTLSPQPADYNLISVFSHAMIKRKHSPIIPDPMMELIKLNDADTAEPNVSPVFCAAINAVPSSSFSWASSGKTQ